MSDRDPTELQALRVLAERGDPRAAPPLLERLLAEPNAEVAELLVRFKLDHHSVARLRSVAVPGDDPDLLLWLALVFARAGRREPLLRLLEELDAGRIDRPLATEPWSGLRDRLAAARPLPDPIVAELRAIEETAGVGVEVLAMCRALLDDGESGRPALHTFDPRRGLGMSPPPRRRAMRERGHAAADLPEADLARTEPDEAAAEPEPNGGPSPPGRRPGLDMAAGAAEPASRRAWPHLDAPDAVVAGVPFDLEVGLRGDPAPGVVVSGPLDLPAGDITVRVAVMAHGFEIGGSFEFDLEVTAADPYPRRTLELTARADDELADERRIYAIYSVGSASRAVAERSVRVVPAPEAIPGAAERTAPEPARADPGADLAPADAAVEADLTICIGRGNDAAGHTLQWSLTPAAIELPAAPEQEDRRVTGIGAKPEEFLDQIVRAGSETPSPRSLYQWLVGRGRTIGDAMPPFVREAIVRVIAARAPEPATILVKSAEPWVPWELAILRELPPDPEAAPFLGARAQVGRWILRSPPPVQDPPRRTGVGDALAISGVYDGVPGWTRLPHAETEPREVIGRIGSGATLSPSRDDVYDCLAGVPPGDVLHFALHGRFERGAARSGLVLLAPHPRVAGEVVEEFLQPDHVLGGSLEGRRPFVFLNACQVGAAEALLGDYGGMAAAFLRVGASAVIAPLWSVHDEAAHRFALDFYDHTLGGDRLPPAELLRRRRAAVTAAAARTAKPEDGLLGVLAYQLYAHPRYTLTRAAAAPPPQETDDG